MIGYKIVGKDLSSFMNAHTMKYCGKINEILSVDYKLNESVFPPKDCGPLAVFKTLESAMRFFPYKGGDIS